MNEHSPEMPYDESLIKREAEKKALYTSFMDIDAYDSSLHTFTQDEVKMLQEIISDLNAEASRRHDIMNADSANLEGPSVSNIPF